MTCIMTCCPINQTNKDGVRRFGWLRLLMVYEIRVYVSGFMKPVVPDLLFTMVSLITLRREDTIGKWQIKQDLLHIPGIFKRNVGDLAIPGNLRKVKGTVTDGYSGIE